MSIFLTFITEKNGFAMIHCSTTVFKTAAFDRSAISPLQIYKNSYACNICSKSFI